MKHSPVLILLAGGKSTRMGSPKGLLNFYGKPWILEQISRYKHIKNPKIYIGLGFDYKQYFKTISWFKEAFNDFYLYDEVEVKVIINKQPDLGAFSTLQTVLNSIDKDESILVQPIDVPLLNQENLNVILNKKSTIVIPKYNNKNGHPVKLKPEFWNTLLYIDITLEKARLDVQIKMLKQSSIAYLNVSDCSVCQNINTIADWKNYLKNN